MKVIRWVGLAWLMLAVAAAAGERSTGGLDDLQGTWSAAAGAKKKVAVTVEIHGTAVEVVIKPPKGPPIKATGAIRVNPSSEPKALDWVGFTGPDGQPFPELLGIYERQGDTFRVCTGGPDNPRPAAFEPGEGMLADVLTFHRAAGSE